MKSNKDIIEQFKLLIKQIKYNIDTTTGKEQLKQTFRLSSVEKALKVIEGIKTKITNGEQLTGITGIGKGTIDRINEIIKTGKLSEITFNNEEYIEQLEKLTNIFGIGRKIAHKLLKTYGNIENIKKKYNNGELILPHNIEIGIKYMNLLKEKIPRKQMDEINDYLNNTLIKIDSQLFGIVCGSYRRQRPYSNDVDFIIVHPNDKNYLLKLIKKLKKNKFIIESLTDENVKTKYMGLFKWKNIIRRIDIRFLPYSSYYTGILYFTGGKNFNRTMRQIAKKKGYTLNEYRLYSNKNKKTIVINSEKDVFDKLELPYIPPEKRNN